jgi:hypothetical protein
MALKTNLTSLSKVEVPIDATLTKTQRNALLPLLTKHGFDPSNFAWDEFITDEPDTFAGVISTNSTRFTTSQ